MNPLNDIGLIRIASLKARHASERHALAAQNVANADTPGYKAKDLEPLNLTQTQEGGRRGLDSGVKRGLDTGVKRGLDSGVPRGNDSGAPKTEFRVRTVTTPGAEAPNGNTVSLENEMARASSASRDHETSTLILSKAVDMLRAALGRKG